MKGHLVRQRLLEGVLLGEEELELEQVAKAHRLVVEGLPLVARRGGGVQERQLGDRAGDEEVQHGVAVVRRGEELVRHYGPHRLGALVEAAHHAVGRERAQVPRHAVGRGELVHRPGGGQAPRLRVAEDAGELVPQLVHRHGAVASAEQRQRQRGAGRDGRGLVDAVTHLEGQLLHREVLLFRLRGRARAGWAQRALERHRLSEAHVDLPVAALQRAQHAQEPAQALLLLRAAARLVRVVADVGDLIVRDGHRHQQHVVGAAAAPRVDDVGQHAEARRQQLARARPAALDVPLHREALLDEEVDVLPQDELVDGVVLEAAANEEDARAAEHRPHREEVHVDAAGRVVGRRAVVVEQVLQDGVVEVRLVRREEDDGLPRLGREQRLQLLAVVVEVLRVALSVRHANQPVHQVDDVRADAGGDLLQVVARAPLHLLRRQAGGLGERREARAELPVREDFLAHEARHLVARAAQRPFGALERQGRLPQHEEGERRARISVALAARLPPLLAQGRRRRRFAGYDAAAVRVARQHPALAQRAGRARVAQGEQVEQPHRAFAAVLPRQPRHPHRCQQRVVALRQARHHGRVEPARVPRAGGRNAQDLGRGARVLRGDPLGDQPALEPAPVDEEDGGARRVRGVRHGGETLAARRARCSCLTGPRIGAEIDACPPKDCRNNASARSATR